MPGFPRAETARSSGGPPAKNTFLFKYPLPCRVKRDRLPPVILGAPRPGNQLAADPGAVRAAETVHPERGSCLVAAASALGEAE